MSQSLSDYKKSFLGRFSHDLLPHVVINHTVKDGVILSTLSRLNVFFCVVVIVIIVTLCVCAIAQILSSCIDISTFLRRITIKFTLITEL